MKRIKTIKETVDTANKAKEIELKVRGYLLSCLEDEDPDRFTANTIQAIRETALDEKRCEMYRYGALYTIRDWLQGLGLGVAFTYYDITNLMREWGYKINEDDEDDYYYKCDLYWDILARVINEGK